MYELKVWGLNRDFYWKNVFSLTIFWEKFNTVWSTFLLTEQQITVECVWSLGLGRFTVLNRHLSLVMWFDLVLLEVGEQHWSEVKQFWMLFKQLIQAVHFLVLLKSNVYPLNLFRIYNLILHAKYSPFFVLFCLNQRTSRTKLALTWLIALWSVNVVSSAAIWATANLLSGFFKKANILAMIMM